MTTRAPLRPAASRPPFLRTPSTLTPYGKRTYSPTSMLLALAASSGLSRSTTPGSTPCCTAMRYRQSPSFTTYPPGTGPRSATAPSAAPFVVFVVGAAPMGACAESGGGGSGRRGGAWDRPWCGFGCECDRSERGGVAGIRWGLGREDADAEPARDRKPPLPSRWSRSILARIAMATTAEPAIIVRRMLPNSVGPSSSSLS
mmetsp:Transcript_1523/g.6696  ORF Transcript_1523/g.6696 Transcript_1523/m.6696 type:complete len:201 (-) Transcript_1523:133-735(-)